MKLSERIKKMLDGMPTNGAITLQVETLWEWLDESGPGGFEPDLTVKQVADLVGRSPVTVRAWIRGSLLRAYRFRNKEWRVPPSALEDFRQEQQEKGGQ